jgi:hypothetical protein
MTADEREKIGILTGTVDGVLTRLDKIEKLLDNIDTKQDEMKEHVAPVAAQLAKELAAYKVDEAKYKVDVINPMRQEVSHLAGRLSDEQVIKIDREEQHDGSSSFRRWLLPFLASIALIGTQILIALFLNH